MGVPTLASRLCPPTLAPDFVLDALTEHQAVSRLLAIMDCRWLKCVLVVCVVLMQLSTEARSVTMASADVAQTLSVTQGHCHSSDNPTVTVDESVPDCCESGLDCQELCSSATAMVCAAVRVGAMQPAGARFLLPPIVRLGHLPPQILRPPITYLT